MNKLLNPTKGLVSAGELVSVLTTLRSSGTPDAIQLANAMESIPMGSAVTEEARNAVTRAVFEWQISSS
jgi:hypothetical protein